MPVKTHFIASILSATLLDMPVKFLAYRNINPAIYLTITIVFLEAVDPLWFKLPISAGYQFGFPKAIRFTQTQFDSIHNSV